MTDAIGWAIENWIPLLCSLVTLWATVPSFGSIGSSSDQGWFLDWYTKLRFPKGTLLHLSESTKSLCRVEKYSTTIKSSIPYGIDVNRQSAICTRISTGEETYITLPSIRASKKIPKQKEGMAILASLQ